MWLAAAAFPGAVEETSLSGSVKDPSGGSLRGAQVLVMTPQRSVVATTTTDAAGRFAVSSLPDGQYVVVVRYPALAERQASVTIAAGKPAALDLTLELAPVGDDVTVTANPGAVGDRTRATQPVNVIPAEEVLARTKTIVAQVVEGEAGVTLQRTSPGMAGIFVRGLTGNKVNIFVDGVRYSNGAQRGGVNTFLDLIDSSTLEMPSTTLPSTGTRSPGRTRNRSPTRTSPSGTSRSTPSRTRRAMGGCSRRSAAIAPLARPRARASSQRPKSTSPMITAAESKYVSGGSPAAMVASGSRVMTSE